MCSNDRTWTTSVDIYFMREVGRWSHVRRRSFFNEGNHSYPASQRWGHCRTPSVQSHQTCFILNYCIRRVKDTSSSGDHQRVFRCVVCFRCTMRILRVSTIEQMRSIQIKYAGYERQTRRNLGEERVRSQHAPCDSSCAVVTSQKRCRAASVECVPVLPNQHLAQRRVCDFEITTFVCMAKMDRLISLYYNFLRP